MHKFNDLTISEKVYFIPFFVIIINVKLPTNLAFHQIHKLSSILKQKDTILMFNSGNIKT